VLSPGPSADSESTSAGKWLVALSVMIGTFLSVMDATVVNVAMPHMMGSFGQDLLTITWVSTAYSIAEIIMYHDVGVDDHAAWPQAAVPRFDGPIHGRLGIGGNLEDPDPDDFLSRSTGHRRRKPDALLAGNRA
jgi:hypothetical protein